MNTLPSSPISPPKINNTLKIIQNHLAKASNNASKGSYTRNENNNTTHLMSNNIYDSSILRSNSLSLDSFDSNSEQKSSHPINNVVKNLVEPLNKIDENEFKQSLASLNLKIHTILGDGNCLFRAIADQVFGNENLHEDIREEIVDYIGENESFCTNFIEDNESFSSYVSRMKCNGTWGGYLELCSAANLLKIQIIIHQAIGPTLTIDFESEYDDDNVVKIKKKH